MISFYFKNALLSYIVLNAGLYITKDNWNKLNPKHNGFIKRNVFKICICLIPLIRWIFTISAVVLGIALSNDEFVKECKKYEDK